MERASCGRQAELARISSFLDAVPTGPEALILGGEAGIGKSALWLDTFAQAQARSDRALSSPAPQGEGPLVPSPPFAPHRVRGEALLRGPRRPPRRGRRRSARRTPPAATIRP